MRSWGISFGGLLGEWLVFAVFAVAATWPLAHQWTTAIPQGTETAGTVPLFNLWSMGWNISRVEMGLSGYWDAPIFFPASDAFAFSEPQPLMMLMAPVLWCKGTLAMAYNLYLWLGLSLSGIAAKRFVKRLTNSPFASWSAGAMMVLLPYAHWQLGLIQLVPVFGTVFTLHALVAFADSPSIVRSLVLGTVFALTYCLCNYYGLFLSLLLLLSAGFLLKRKFFHWKTVAKLLPGGLWALLLLSPLVLHQRQVSQERNWERPAELIQQQSAHWGDFTATPWPQLLPIPEFVEDSRLGWTLSPGYLKIGLALLGILCGLMSPSLRRVTLFLTAFTILGGLMAMGPNFGCGSWVPYDSLRQFYPGLKMARNVFRFVVFAQIGIVLLAALGLAGLWRGLATGDHRTGNHTEFASRRRFAARMLLVGLGILSAVEVWPASQELCNVPKVAQQRGWIDWIEQNTQRSDVLACIPFPQGGNAPAYFDTTVWMYYGLEHERPLVNGYSGFFPARFLDLKHAMANFPDEKSLSLLKASGAKYCIVDRKSLPREKLKQNQATTHQLRLRFRDNRAEVDIYELLPRPP